MPEPLPPTLPEDLLSRPAEEGARRIVLQTLAKTEAASRRLGGDFEAPPGATGTPESEPSEALHDFRVGVRRLRSQLRAFRPLLGDGSGDRVERRFRDVARATNRGRDAEVQSRALEILASPAGAVDPAGADRQLSRPAQRVAGRLASELRARFEKEERSTLASARRDFERAAARLAKQLSTMQVTIALDRETEIPPRSFGSALADAVERELKDTRARLASVEGMEPPEPLHEARIAAKRLRYLLEAAREVDPVVPSALQALKAIQDLLGEFHDAEVLGELASRAVPPAGQEERSRGHRRSAPQRTRRRGAETAPGARGGRTARTHRPRASSSSGRVARHSAEREGTRGAVAGDRGSHR